MRPRPEVMAVACAAALGGCDITLRADDRLTFVAPPEGAIVETPLRVEWQVAEGRAARFAVFVDRPPMRPGETIHDLARRDVVCRTSPGCPDATWLEQKGVYLVDTPEALVTLIRRDRGRPGRHGRRHELTVVLLDAGGHRTTEAYWTRSVYIEEAL